MSEKLASHVHETMTVVTRMGTPVTHVYRYPCPLLLDHPPHAFEYVRNEGVTYIQECPGVAQ